MMEFVEFGQFSLWTNIFLFAAGAVVVWAAGTRLSRYADTIAERTQVGTAFIGALLLGGVTSLPEIATTLTASVSQNAPLAVNNVLGGVAMQVAVLALADFTIGRRALSGLMTGSVVLLQGVLLVFVLALTAAGITTGAVPVLGVDVWTATIFVTVLLGLFTVKRYESRPQWQVERTPAADVEPMPVPSVQATRRRDDARQLSQARLATYTTLASLIILAGGFLVARTGDALAEQSGLGASFVGAILLAIATSLPEVSTTMEAVRLGEYRMAFSNIFGTNLFDVALLFLADLAYAGPAVLDEVGAFSQFGALLGMILTSVYLVGILSRRRRTVARLGIDSLLVLLLYLGGVVLLYALR